MIIKRKLSEKLKYLCGKFPVAAVIGPRQSGKTTLVKSTFPDYKYVSLEELDIRDYAINDPRSFLKEYPEKVIFDEIQRVPSLFSYIQTAVDKNRQAGRYILTGSQNFLLPENISQSLSGRVALLSLLPFSHEELKGTPLELKNLENYMFTGFYPGIYDKEINPSDFHSNYVKTYVERDVRQIKKIPDLNSFHRFLKLCAGRCGQLLNLSSLANDCGITHNTAKSWISVLETGYIITLLRPHHRNFSKRLVKMPKIYFNDTGLLCFLLGLYNPDDARTHYLKGGIFENFIINEMSKYWLNTGRDPELYFWRDKTGHEIDCVFERAGKLVPVEIKSGETVNRDFFKNLDFLKKISGQGAKPGYVIYGGDRKQSRGDGTVLSWKNTCAVYNG